MSKPTLWRCSRCLYSYWSFGEEQDPGMEHCVPGRWLRDEEAIAALADSAWTDYKREYWMGPT